MNSKDELFKMFLLNFFKSEKALSLDYEGDSYDDNGDIIFDTAYCPICRNQYEVDYDTHDNYCRNCGQKLDWNRRLEENDNT